MGKTKKKGAKRAKMGRKPVPKAFRMVLVGFYTRQSNIDKIGGMPAARQWAKESLEGHLADPSLGVPIIQSVPEGSTV